MKEHQILGLEGIRASQLAYLSSQIKVEVYKEVSNLVFKIYDNGKGFDLASVKRGNGLTNMEKRIANIGGEIKINTKENQGTQIIVIV